MSPAQLLHHPRHFQRRLRRLRAAVVLFAEAPDSGLFHLFENEHAVDDGQLMEDLDLRQRVLTPSPMCCAWFVSPEK